MKQKDLYADELSEWLESVLDTEFDVLSEDGTLLPTSKLLIQLTNLIMNRGGETEEEAKEKLDEHLQKLRGAAAKSVCYLWTKNDKFLQLRLIGLLLAQILGVRK